MSEIEAAEFIEKARTDQELATQLEAATSREERLAIARSAGFQFTEDEFEAARARVSDAQLDAVAGGNCCNCGWTDVGF